jgi:hypothetical protein
MSGTGWDIIDYAQFDIVAVPIMKVFDLSGLIHQERMNSAQPAGLIQVYFGLRFPWSVTGQTPVKSLKRLFLRHCVRYPLIRNSNTSKSGYFGLR